MNSTNINDGLNPILGDHLTQASVSFTEMLRSSPIVQWAMAFDALLKEVQKSPGMKALIEMNNNIAKIKVDPDILKVPPLGLPLR